MSTSCIVRFLEHGKPLCAFYKHYDGNTFGEKLKTFYSTKKIVDGLGLDTTNEANGIADLAAQTIANFKTRPGDIYMTPVDDDDNYVYNVYIKDNKVCVVPE